MKIIFLNYYFDRNFGLNCFFHSCSYFTDVKKFPNSNFLPKIGVWQNMISDKWEGEVSRFQKFFWQGKWGVSQFLILGWQLGGWVWTPPFLADIICEQPLTNSFEILIFTFLSQKCMLRAKCTTNGEGGLQDGEDQWESTHPPWGVIARRPENLVTLSQPS